MCSTSVEITGVDGLGRIIIHDGMVYTDTLRTCEQMARMEHKHYLKHDCQVMQVQDAPHGLYYIKLRANARRRMEAWYAKEEAVV